MGDECARSDSGSKVTFRVKFLQGEVDRESRDPQISRKRARGGKTGGVIAKTAGDQFIANLSIKLLMQRFGRIPDQPDHFESDD
jgi:hypothetical protein